jgi:hypothetical protein
MPEQASDLGETKRGKEKRRLLIEYIRRHPEELRPIAQPSRRARAVFTK